MTDAMGLLIGFILSIGMTFIAFRANERFLPYLFSGVLWLGLGFMALEMNFILSICCICMCFYMLLRSIYK